MNTEQFFSPDNQPLTPDQNAAVAARLAEVESPWWDVCRSDALVSRGPERFAVFGAYAHKLMHPHRFGDERAEFEYLPVVDASGQAVAAWPQEGGRGGVITLARMVCLNGQPVDKPWLTILFDGGWLRTDELVLTSEEIHDRIVDEADRGENVITRKPPGWV